MATTRQKWEAKQKKLAETFYTDYYPGGATVKKILPAMRIWADALGVRFDPWASCTNLCHYCFARALSHGMCARNRKIVSDRSARPGNVKAVERTFRQVLGEGRLRPFDWVDWAVSKRYFMEVGTLGEPMQPADRKFRPTWNLLSLMRAYDYPLFLNTKGNLLCSDDAYYDALVSLKTKIVDLALVARDDDLLRKYEPFAPPPSVRYELIKRLSKDGVPVVISCRPILKGVTDGPDGTDWEDYIKWLIDGGVQGIHLRTLIIVGKLYSKKLWKDYVVDQGMKLFHGEYRYPKEYFVDLYERATKVCEDAGSDVKIVGTRRYWFDLGGYHGKTCFDSMSKDVQDALVPWTIVPIYRTIQQQKDEAQLLVWEKVGYPKPQKDGFLDKVLLTNDSACLIFNDCWTRNWRGKYIVSGEDFFRYALWDGFRNPGPAATGEIVHTHRIYRVYDDEADFYPTSEKAALLAYVPPALKRELVKKKKGIGTYVPYAAAKDLRQTERKAMYVPPVV